MTTFTSIDFGEGLEMGVSGPPLAEGPLPALFYFALSAKDSLCLDPYNQPVAYLSSRQLRVFSVTLPFHEPPRQPQDALAHWAQAFLQGHDILAPFIHSVVRVIEKIAHLGYASKIAVAGLSRGALIATHIAAHSTLVQYILGFAPLTRLGKAREFQEFSHHSLIDAYDIHHRLAQLIGKPLRFYIGNRDERVGTAACFSVIEQLAEASYQSKIRSPQVELVIFPSIGHQGHGTPKEIFEQGAEWISQKIEAANA